MKNIKLKKGLTAILSAALITTFTVVIPSTARADVSCTEVSKLYSDFSYEECVGTDFQGANFKIRMPEKFNGTLFLYSHGIRNQVLLPIIPGVNPDGSYSSVRNMPDVAPGRTAADQEANALNLLSQGYALAGASPRVQGWAVPEAIEANMNLLEEAKTLYPKKMLHTLMN